MISRQNSMWTRKFTISCGSVSLVSISCAKAVQLISRAMLASSPGLPHLRVRGIIEMGVDSVENGEGLSFVPRPRPPREGKGLVTIARFLVCAESAVFFETTNQIARFKIIMRHKPSMNYRPLP